ncbi:MAG: glycosyl transferase family 1 [Nitrospirae bacterium GWD2_57_9]|nr:MAG: glycosyl transferase family 1 [Nitrospirae bacterium GWD2_57_9]
MISQYYGVAPKGDLMLLQQLCGPLRKRRFLHINSTKEGGGVAEILHRMIPMLQELGVDARWEVIKGDAVFYDMTKKVHNSLQGDEETFTKEMWDYHYEINRRNAENLDLDADAVLVHDPQPAPLIQFRKNGTWMWRCHIDVSNPRRETWDMVRKYSEKYNAAIFSVSRFAKAMRLDEFIVPPSIDPISEKNRELSAEEIQDTATRFSIPSDRPVLLQVSRFDRFKDPLGVIKAYRMAKKYNDCVLVLAGSPASDDPEGEKVLNEVRQYASDDPDIRILLLPPFSDKDINALQRMATVILQKSLKEGFGLTVSEAMWKGKPVIGGAVGGIPLQVVHGVTGFLVHSVEGAAFRIRQFLNNPEMGARMGERAREFVRNNFLITRQMRDYLSIWYALENSGRRTLEL